MDRENVITHLQIIHTWASFARERDLQFFTEKHLEDIAQWSDDAIDLLKEQEDFGTELTNAVELIHKKNERIEKLLKEQEYKDKLFHALENDWIRLKELLKEQQEERKRMLSWLSKFCRHIDNGDKWLTDEENLEFFREKMKQQFGWFTD